MDKSQSSKPSVLSLFSGCGGLDLGFINAGFEIIWANDFFPEAVSTYKRNIGDHINGEDITKLDINLIPNNFDVLLGGFPCQGFSIANNKRSMSDERNYLYKEMLNIIDAKRPKVFVGENVKGLLSMGKGEVIKMIADDFRKIGYKVEYRLLNSAHYGVPQFRQRVIMIGNRFDLDNIYPEVTHGDKDHLEDFVSVKSIAEELADLRISYDPIDHNNKKIYNHIARTNVHDKFWARKNKVNQHDICDYLKEWRNKKGISTKKVDEIFGYKHTAGHWFRKDNNSGSIPNPKDWWKLKEILGFDDRFDKKVTELELKEIKFEQSLRINNWDRPSDTITATGPEIHPNKERRMSVRECARIQTFPEDFIFEGSLGNMYKQIGNAVPVLFAEKIGLAVKELLNKIEQYESKSKP
jgi:DNA (cytosine-5)-methyltransferase 1